MNLEAIEHHTKHFADCDTELSQMVSECRAKLDKIANEYRPRLLAAGFELARARDVLFGAISGNAALFDKPRTRLFSGIEVGLRKSSSSVDWARKEADIIAQIEAEYPQYKHALIDVKKVLKKVPCGELPEELRVKLGIQKHEGDDAVVIARPKDGLSALVDAVMATFKGAL